MNKTNKLLFSLSFSIYMILLIWVAIFKWTNYHSVIVSVYTFRPMDLAARYDYGYDWFFYFELTDLILNMLLFIPLGLYYFKFFKNIIHASIFGIILMITFEISQFFTCIGMFNVYDLLGNFLGLLFGYLIYLLIKKIYTPRNINITNIILIILFLPVTIYAIYMTITNIDVYITIPIL